jgi:L-fuconolactonase
MASKSSHTPPVPHPDAAWLALRDEPVLEPDLSIIDAHHHLWDKTGARFLLDEFAADLAGGHNVLATVFIEATAKPEDGDAPPLTPLDEVRMARGVAEESLKRGRAHVCAAIVAHADLREGAGVEPTLEALAAASGRRFRGVRQSGARHELVRNFAPVGLLADARFREGFGRLQALGYTYDAWLYHPQLGELIELMRVFPEARVALDHMGGRIGVGDFATRREELFATWRADLAALAMFPNLCVKIGGQGMPMAGFGWHERARPPSSAELASAWQPYVETCIEFFGPRRCMFESNFPVDKVSCSYTALWNAFKLCANGRSAEEKAWLFERTARRFYSID